MKIMRKTFLVALLLGGFAAVNAGTIDFTISLTGNQETPPNASGAIGGGIASFDPILDEISLSVSFAGLTTPATASHIHVAAPGVAGPVIVSFVPFTPSATFGSIVGGPLAFPAGDVAALLAGNTYFNIHDSVFPGGEIRGQLLPVGPASAPDCGSTLGMLGFALFALAWASQRSGFRLWCRHL